MGNHQLSTVWLCYPALATSPHLHCIRSGVLPGRVSPFCPATRTLSQSTYLILPCKDGGEGEGQSTLTPKYPGSFPALWKLLILMHSLERNVAFDFRKTKSKKTPNLLFCPRYGEQQRVDFELLIIIADWIMIYSVKLILTPSQYCKPPPLSCICTYEWIPLNFK